MGRVIRRALTAKTGVDMGMMVKLLLVLLLASGIAYYLVPLLTSGSATELVPVTLASGGTDSGPSRPMPSRTSTGNIRAVATVEAAQRTPYALKAGGLVLAVNAREGERVEAGQVLVELDAGDLAFSSRSATMAVADAEARVERTKFDLAQAAEKLRNARDTARDAEAEAGERLKQAEQDQRHGQDKANTAIADAQAAVAMAEAKLARALYGFNRSRSLAKLEPVVAGLEGELVVPRRPASTEFDDSVIKYNDYVESELAFGEALLAANAARQSVSKAEMAKNQHAESAGLAVNIAQARLGRSKRDAAAAEAALVAHAKSSEFLMAQAHSALAAAQLESERFQSTLERMTIRATAEDAGSIVAEVLVRRGDTVTPGTRAVILHKPDRLIARCYLPVDRLPSFQTFVTSAGANGLVVNATTSAFDGSMAATGRKEQLQWKGKLIRHSSAINPSSMAFLVEVELDRLPVGLAGELGAGWALQPGMVVTLDFGPTAAK